MVFARFREAVPASVHHKFITLLVKADKFFKSAVFRVVYNLTTQIYF